MRERTALKPIISQLKKEENNYFLAQMNSTTYSDDDTTLGGFGYGVGLSIAVLVVFVIITYFSYKCKSSQRDLHSASLRRRRRSTADDYTGSVHVVIHRDGLDAAAISTFPLYTFAQLKPHKGDSAAASGCAVCIADYKDGDAVRLLPDCGHIFHRSCIDPWLMIHPTCPICRNSPLPAAVAAAPLVVAQPAPVANQ